jgi:uncharacterized protein YodC (DUF2158 family)
MKLTTKFDIKQKVHIKELTVNGTVQSISIGKNGIEYTVKYYAGGDQKTACFWEEELEPEVLKPATGFAV